MLAVLESPSRVMGGGGGGGGGYLTVGGCHFEAGIPGL